MPGYLPRCGRLSISAPISTPSTPEIYATGILLAGENIKARTTATRGGIKAGIRTPRPGTMVDIRKHIRVVIIVAKNVGRRGALGKR